MMQERKNIYNAAEDDITLGDIVLKTSEYLRVLRRNWWILVISALIVSGIAMLASIWNKTSYIADMTFTVANSEKSGGSGGVSGILGQFGLGSVGGGSGLNTARVVELAKTMEIVGSVLMKEAKINNNSDFIANHVMNIYGFQEEWGKKNKELIDFRFTHNQTDSFTRVENAVYKRLYAVAVNRDNGFLAINYDEVSGIFKMQMKTISEPLSIILLKEEYVILSEYFIEKTVAPEQQRFEVVKARLDSITTELQRLDYSVARSKDRSLGIFEQTSSVAERQLLREQQLASISYTEVKRNVEAARFALSSVKPVFQTIDEAIAPLKKEEISLAEAGIVGAALGMLIAAGFLFIRKIIKDSMQVEE